MIISTLSIRDHFRSLLFQLRDRHGWDYIVLAIADDENRGRVLIDIEFGYCGKTFGSEHEILISWLARVPRQTRNVFEGIAKKVERDFLNSVFEKNGDFSNETKST